MPAFQPAQAPRSLPRDPRSLSQEESRGARGPPGFEVRVTATVRRFLLAEIVADGSDCRPTEPDWQSTPSLRRDC